MMSLKRQQGLTLVELMIASVVALIMLAGVGQLFLSTRQMNVTDEELADVQSSARYIMQFISEQVRQAGMLGCADLDEGNYTSSITAYDEEYYHPFNIGIQGYRKGISALPSVLQGIAITGGSDILVVRRATEEGFRLSQEKDSTSFYTEFVSTTQGGCKGGSADEINGICPDDILVAVDCRKARSFVASSLNTMDIGGDTVVQITHGTGNTPQSWGDAGSDNPLDKFDVRDTTINKAATTAYYVGSDGGFMMKINSSSAERLASGIEFMRIQYGVDTDDDGSVNKYVDADLLSSDLQVADNFNRVISLEVALLISSLNSVLNPNEIPSGSQDYNLLGTVINRSNDGKLRKVYRATIHLRNGGVG
ncbi:MAG: PilW family protein [Gammaproteobacteria bacterium]|nr:PilW family protein [Gammaproteobacteria bacterium]